MAALGLTKPRSAHNVAPFFYPDKNLEQALNTAIPGWLCAGKKGFGKDSGMRLRCQRCFGYWQ
jgi:hypothetical protein